MDGWICVMVLLSGTDSHIAQLFALKMCSAVQVSQHSGQTPERGIVLLGLHHFKRQTQNPKALLKSKFMSFCMWQCSSITQTVSTLSQSLVT